MARKWLAVPAIVAILALSACGSSNATTSSSSGPARLTVLAAASLVNVFPKIGTMFTAEHPGVTFRFSFAGTDTLTAQIEQGAKADVFAGASTTYGDELSGKGLIETPQPFCTNQLVLVVPPSNPANITSLKDLTNKGIKLVVAGPTVPVGSYTLKVLGSLDSTYGANYSKQVLANVVSQETDVEAVLAKVKLGEADAGFVYITDSTAAGSSVKAITLPAYAQATATYPIAVVKASTNSGLAGQFVSYVLSPPAQQVLQSAGFGPPPTS
ncbi:MAG TPA: molybdate ABC transporter substrate-binding protein [Actinomycetota bacterium]|jgi:molybdate transport system substrate-binding protein